MKFSLYKLLFLSLFIFSCGKSKTNESVFPNEAFAACASQTIKNQFIVGWEDGTYTLESDETENSFRENFIKNNLQKIRHIDRDYKIQLKNLEISPNTKISVRSSDFQWQVDKINARSVWNQGFQGQDVIVGVVDGMVDVQHNQLKNNILYSQQFNTEVNNPITNKHGTHVSGIIAADPNSGPVSGIAPRAKIAAGQFISNDGSGSIGEAILAMTSVANQGARIINLSWGGAPCVSNLKSALEQLSARGILIVTAAGNEATDSDFSPTYPAAFMIYNQLNIAATGLNDLITSFSNRGYKTVQLAAPGQTIYSTTPGNTIQAMDGTSMSAPVVSGAAALLMSAVPQSSAQQVKQALMNSVDISGSRLQVTSGGRINVKNALVELKRLVLK